MRDFTGRFSLVIWVVEVIPRIGRLPAVKWSLSVIGSDYSLHCVNAVDFRDDHVAYRDVILFCNFLVDYAL